MTTVKIEKFVGHKNQVFSAGNKRWKVTSLIAKAQGLPVESMPLNHLNIYNLSPRITSMRNWVSHIKSVLAADLDCPIILGDDGYVMDGRHRIARALLEEKETIKFVRFEEDPSPDYYEDEDE